MPNAVLESSGAASLWGPQIDPTLGISILKTSPLDRSGRMCGGYLAVCQERTRLMLSGLIRTWLFALTVQILDFVNKQDSIWSVSRFTLTKLKHLVHMTSLPRICLQLERNWNIPTIRVLWDIQSQSEVCFLRNQNKGGSIHNLLSDTLRLMHSLPQLR